MQASLISYIQNTCVHISWMNLEERAEAEGAKLARTGIVVRVFNDGD